MSKRFRACSLDQGLFVASLATRLAAERHFTLFFRPMVRTSLDTLRDWQALSQIRSSPVTGDKDPTTRSRLPARRSPHRAISGGMNPIAGDPDIMVPVPTPISVYPHPSRMWHGSRMFNDYRRRRNPNENTSRVSRAGHEDGTQTGDARFLDVHRTAPIYRRTPSSTSSIPVDSGGRFGSSVRGSAADSKQLLGVCSRVLAGSEPNNWSSAGGDVRNSGGGRHAPWVEHASNTLVVVEVS